MISIANDEAGAIPEGSNTTTAPTSQAGVTTDVSDTGEPNEGPFGDDVCTVNFSVPQISTEPDHFSRA